MFKRYIYYIGKFDIIESRAKKLNFTKIINVNIQCTHFLNLKTQDDPRLVDMQLKLINILESGVLLISWKYN